MPLPTLNLAIETFARGFAFTRSFTYPFHAERFAPLWVVRDAPRKRAADYRTEEWIAADLPAAKVDAIARQHTRGRFWVCAIRAQNQPDAPLRADYKSLGYRLHSTEAFMAHPLQRTPRLAQPFPIRQILTQPVADLVAQAAGRRLALPEHLAKDSPLRLYAAFDNNRPIGWLRSITVNNCAWVASVHVEPDHRRQGIGKSLLAKMLRDDRARGAKYSILLASHTGAMLYPTVGYIQIGHLFMYSPPKKK